MGLLSFLGGMGTGEGGEQPSDGGSPLLDFARQYVSSITNQAIKPPQQTAVARPATSSRPRTETGPQNLRRLFPFGRQAVGGHMGAGGPLTPLGGPNAELPMPGADEANALLGQYGLSMPGHIKQNIFLPDSFAGHHPLLSRMIEGGVLGGALTNGGETVGENIQNVFRGLLAAKDYRNNAINAQLDAPFQTAQLMGNLQGMQDKHKLAVAQAQAEEARAEYYRNGEDKSPYVGGAPTIDATNGYMYRQKKDGSMEQLMTPDGKPMISETYKYNQDRIDQAVRGKEGTLQNDIYNENNFRKMHGLPEMSGSEQQRFELNWARDHAMATAAGRRQGNPTPGRTQDEHADKESLNKRKSDRDAAQKELESFNRLRPSQQYGAGGTAKRQELEQKLQDATNDYNQAQQTYDTKWNTVGKQKKPTKTSGAGAAPQGNGIQTPFGTSSISITQ